MENYQMFFPCSSSSSSAYYNNNPSMDQHHHQAFNNNNNVIISKDGFLGLGSDDQNDHNHDHHDGNNNSNDNNNKKKLLGVVMKKNNDDEKKNKKVKKQKFAFQTRSQVDILDDGYRWRKYGQKAVKNNTFPRSYYRCTHHGCNVKKQVQRLTKDEGVVVTTYEGMHTHPIEKHTDNFEHILNQMHIYNPNNF
jgi:hypothetical protein